MTTTHQINLMDSFQLSPSQKRTIELLMKGLSNKEISNILHITEKAIKCQLTHIYKKTRIDTRARLIVFLSEKGWFTNQPFINNNLPIGL